MANETVTTNLVGICKEIRTRSLRYMAQEGVMKEIVHTFTGGDIPKGTQVSEPVFDPTTYSGTAGTEGTSISANVIQLTTTRRTYTASEWVGTSFITYNDIETGSEDVKQLASLAHAHAHAEKLETKLLNVYASFSSFTITATSTSGLSWAKIAAGRAKLEDQQHNFTNEDKYLVISPNAEYLLAVELARNSNYGPSGTLGNNVLDKYHVNTVAGVNVMRTAYLSATSTQICGMHVKPAIGLFVSRNYRVEYDHQARGRGYDIVSSMVSGARLRINAGGVKYTVYGKTPS
jgi:hypothetical protein